MPAAGRAGRTETRGSVRGGNGPGALNKLQAAGIKVFRTTGGTVSEVVDAVESGIMQVMTLQGACGRHAGCAH